MRIQKKKVWVFDQGPNAKEHSPVNERVYPSCPGYVFLQHEKQKTY